MVPVVTKLSYVLLAFCNATSHRKNTWIDNEKRNSPIIAQNSAHRTEAPSTEINRK